MTIDTSLGNSYFLESEKNYKLAKSAFLVCVFEKPLTMQFQICKNLCKILNNLVRNFLLTGCMQIICQNFFAKLVQSVFLSHKLYKELKIIKIWLLKVGQNKHLVCYRKKHSFRQCKRRVLDLKGGLWVFMKILKVSTDSDYLLS